MFTRAQVRDIRHYAVQSPGKQHLIFIIQRDDDEHLRLPRFPIQHLTESKLFVLKVRRITCRSAIPHMGKLAIILVGEGA